MKATVTKSHFGKGAVLQSAGVFLKILQNFVEHL